VGVGGKTCAFLLLSIKKWASSKILDGSPAIFRLRYLGRLRLGGVDFNPSVLKSSEKLKQAEL